MSITLSRQARDLTGEVFGSLTAIRPVGKKGRNVVWEFKCKCGETYTSEGCWVTAQKRKATNPLAPSCGCLNRETARTVNYKHGYYQHPLFWVWVSMLERCYRPTNTKYHCYGGLGVTVCPEWRESAGAFIDWALANGWEQGLCLDKDLLCNKLNISPKLYSPETCTFLSVQDSSALTSRRKHPK